MNNEYDRNSLEQNVIKYLKKNKNFFIKFPQLTKELNFPTKDNGAFLSFLFLYIWLMTVKNKNLP